MPGGATLHKRGVVISLSGWEGGGSQLGECCLGSTRVGKSKRIEPFAAALESTGCEHQRDDAMRAMFADCGPQKKSKIAIAGGTQCEVFFLNWWLTQRLALREYLQIVSATNFKQRVRKTPESFPVDRSDFLVLGTPDRLNHNPAFLC